MDWIDPRKVTGSFYPAAADTQTEPPRTSAKRKGAKAKSPRRRGKSLHSQISAALAQPMEVWAEVFDQTISQLKWPKGCSAESTFLFSTVILEQAEVLVRAGMSGKKLAAIVSSGEGTKAEQLSEIVSLMEQSLESAAYQWLDEAHDQPRAALGVSALLWHVHEHAPRAGNAWLPEWFQAVSDRMHSYKPDLGDPVLCHLVLQCELPLLVGVATGASRSVVLAEASRAMDDLAEYLERSGDDPAIWLAHGGTYLRAALACVTRCRVLANQLGMRQWYPPQQKSLSTLIQHAARWSRPDGTHMLGATVTAPKATAVWNAITAQTRRSKTLLAALAAAKLGDADDAKATSDTPAAKFPALTQYSEDASSVCMRSDWRHKSGQVALDFSAPGIIVEALGSKGARVLSGTWDATVKRDGQLQEQTCDWSELCWFSDEDVDYLELEAKFGTHARIQRQAILFREDRLLMLADSLLCDEPGQWSCSATIPTAPEADIVSSNQTTEMSAQLGTKSFLMMPLFLPEWRRQLTQDSFKSEDDQTTTTVHTNGTARAYMPTLISLCGSHAKNPFTWRHLTVGEDLRIVTRDEAVAYRVQFGDQQRLVYRTLAPATRRTTLGMHTMADFFAGRFDAEDGDTDTLVEVDPASA